MAAFKPLPDLPLPTNLSALSNEARQHRARLIRHFLLDGVQDGTAQTTVDDWTHAFEDALDGFTLKLAQGNWLGGIRNGRQFRAQAAKEDELRAETGSSDRAESVDGNSKGRTKEKDARSTRSSTEQALDHIRTIVARPNAGDPPGAPTRKHLLLCVSPYGAKSFAQEESYQFPAMPRIQCTFLPDVFMLPSSETNPADSKASLLYGFAEWDGRFANPQTGPLSFIGGTFTLKGVISLEQHRELCRTLRLCIYVQLSLVLEQRFLLDSQTPLTIQPPRPARRTSTPPLPPPSSASIPTGIRKHRHSFSPSGILSFISRHTHGLRFSGSSEELRRSQSIDEMAHEPEQPTSPIQNEPTTPEGPDLPFTLSVRRIQDYKDLFSTSFGVSIPVPRVLALLAEKEHKHPGRRLTGDEHTALTSILGWAGKDDGGKRMSGTVGFLQHQGLSVLFSYYLNVPINLDSSSQTDLPASAFSSQSASSKLMRCGRPRWIIYRYYDSRSGFDLSLGECLFELASEAELPCHTSGCRYKRGEHQSRFLHAGYRITIGVKAQEEIDPQPTDPDHMSMWESCEVCGAKNAPIEMSDGTYLLSFGKFLELLVYSPTLCSVKPSLCDHTTPPPQPWGDTLPTSRLNINRHFSVHGYIISISLSVIEDIFEVKVPRLQLTRAIVEKVGHQVSASREGGRNRECDEQRKVLRREIKRWWEGMADHLDKLEDKLGTEDGRFIQKTLPRLPSSDDAYDSVSTEDVTTPRATHILSFPHSPQSELLAQEHNENPPSPYSVITNAAQSNDTLLSTISLDPSLTEGLDPKELLNRMRLAFQQSEQLLYAQLSQPPTSVNDTRRSFIVSARGAKKRLLAWQKKHKVSLGGQVDDNLEAEEPSWWAKGCHVLPGGDIIVREDDWGSIIAYTLGSADYEHELMKMALARIDPNPPPLPSHQTASSSVLTASTGFRFFNSSIRSQLDPDQESVVWEEPEAYSAVITRKEHPKDPASILSIRGVLASQRTPVDGLNSPGSRGGSQGKAMGELVAATPPSAWTKPDTQVFTEPAERSDAPQLPDATVLAEKILYEIKSQSIEPHAGQTRDPSQGSTIEQNETPGTSAIKESQDDRREKNASTFTTGTVTTTSSMESDATAGKAESQKSLSVVGDLPVPPPKDSRPSNLSDVQTPVPRKPERTNTAQSASSFTSTLTSGFNYAMRFVRNSDVPQTPPPMTGAHHALLSADTSRISDRPHIKYDWTIGKRLKFSCTVYYALQFDQLRKRCGVENGFLKSLSRSTNWSAEGGKSKSNFWKTADDRFIIKTLVNAWNVADLQVLIDLAPSYFKYIESTGNRSSVLAKMVGFYTIEIRNLETGNVQSKADLLVMENLFYERKVVKTFDLKGIQGRRVKASAAKPSKTLFDGEWIEGQQKTLTLIQPHSKVILREAIKNDAEFLAKSNIMDYSLLIGVDEENKHIACGLVDTIGSYTFAKTLEYKAKQGLNSGKEVTVIPPAEYQERFVNAIEGYFLACPDKWSKPLNGDVAVIDDPEQLPCPL